MTSDLALNAYLLSVQEQLQDGLKKIEHCLSQLTLEEIWWRPREEMNSIANLLLHLSGNLRQWLICGLTELPDERRRQEEFDERTRQSSEELLMRLKQTIDEACECINGQDWNALLASRRVQEFDCNGFQTIADSVCHFRGHVQEIIHMTRFQKGLEYRFDFIPDYQRE